MVTDNQNILSLLRRDAHIAIISGRQEITFKELFQRVEARASGLKELGIKPGWRVLLLMPMSIELYVSLLALFWIDATVMLVDPSAPIGEILSQFKPKGFIGSPKAHLLRLKYPQLRGLAVTASNGFVPLPNLNLNKISGPPIPIQCPQHPALLTFTSGTTGTPKAIARSHSFLLAQHRALAHHMNFKPGDRDMPTLPVFLLHSLAAGATCVLADADLADVGSVNGQKIINQIRQKNISSMSGSPAFFRALVAPLIKNTQSLGSIRHIFTGGGRVFSSDIDALKSAFPEATITIVYGSTEAEPIATLDALNAHEKLVLGEREGRGALVGHAVPEVSIRVVDDEIWVSGEHVNKGYYQSPQHDEESKVNDAGQIWHKTGDAGYLDSEKNIWLLGRMGESIDGLWPMPIEGAVQSLVFVSHAALVEFQTKPVLALVLKEPPSNWEAVIRGITTVPILQVSNIPVDPRHNSKIDRKSLLKLVLKQRKNLR